MKYCRNCGNELEDQAVFCPNCGTAQEAVNPPQGAPYQAPNQASYTPAPEVDNGGFGWGLLGFCIPIVGLILFLVWKDTKPKTSKASGIGALVSVIAVALFYVIMMVAGLATIAMLS